MCPVHHSIADDAFMYSWIGTSLYGNFVYIADFITRTFKRALTDFNKDPFNTSFMVVLHDWHTAPWYPILDQSDIVKNYDAGYAIFTCPAAAIYSSGNLRPAGGKGRPDRILVQDTKWPGVVVTKNRLNPTRIKPANLRYALSGHVAPSMMKAVIRSEILACTDVTVHMI